MSNQPVGIEAIRVREAKATKGPWFHSRMSGREVRHVDSSGDECFICKPFTSNADSEFIAHSRQDIPALCNEVEALRARVKELEASLKDAAEGMEDMFPYVPEYFREKWSHQDYIDRARTALAIPPPVEPTKGDEQI